MKVSDILRKTERFKDRLKTDEPLTREDIADILLDLHPKFKPAIPYIIKDLPPGELNREVKDRILEKLGYE